MRVFIAITLGLLMSGCSAQSYDPQAAIEIHAAANQRTELIEATKVFGKRNGFVVHASSGLVRDGRHVEQIDLHRSDGVLFSMDNFMHADILEAIFYAKKPEADWRTIKAAWQEEMRITLNGHGKLIEVPVGLPPSRKNKEPRQRDDQAQ